MKEENPDEKFIIFTEYLNTQDYVVRKLREIYEKDDVVFIRGGDLQQKIDAAKAFRKSAHFLVSTQAGGEGINLQHCHIIINYDMPWNPMKVEQRIGRVHRYKQKDTVHVYNMLAKGTVEEVIYQRLETKLDEITQMIGDERKKEAFRESIVGIIAEKLNFEELYKAVVKEGQQIDEITKEKIDAAIEWAKDAYEKLGDLTQDMEKFNLRKYFQTKGEVSLEELEKFVLDFVKSEGRKISKDEEGNYEFITPEILQRYGERKYRRITFDREKAIEDQNLEFMAIGHEVTDSIIKQCSGYSYGGRCVKRQISNAEHKGEAGMQFNFIVEYQVPQPEQTKNKILQRDFHVLMFDTGCNYREELKELGFTESQKEITDGNFSFATKDYLEQAEKAAHQKIQEIIAENVKRLQSEYTKRTLKFPP